MQNVNVVDVDELAMRELADVELKVLTSYTLADAIREGSATTDQAFDHWVSGDRACAIGAGYLAARARGFVI